MRRLRVVANGVDLDSLQQARGTTACRLARWGPAFSGRVLFGRLTPVKRIDVIVEMAAVLEREAPGQFGVYLFGEGPLRSELEQQVQKLGLEAVVHFIWVYQPAGVMAAEHARVAAHLGSRGTANDRARGDALASQ